MKRIIAVAALALVATASAQQQASPEQQLQQAQGLIRALEAQRNSANNQVAQLSAALDDLAAKLQACEKPKPEPAKK